MPLYDYECRDCKKKTEHFCCVADRPDALPCPKCGGAMRQVILKPAAVFGDELTKYMRGYVGDAHHSGCLQNNAAVAAGKEKPITTRQEFFEALERKEISIDRNMKTEA